jgi:hypothetical protein
MGLGVYDGTRVDVRLIVVTGVLGFFPELGQLCKVQIRLIGQDTGAASNGLGAQLGTYDDTSGLGMRELLLVLGMAEKAHLPDSSRFKWRNSGYFLRWVAMKLPPQGTNNQTEVQAHASTALDLNYLTLPEFSALMTFSVMSCLGLT